MSLKVRKIVTYAEEVLLEGGHPVPTQHLLAASALVMTNPWHGMGFVQNLRPTIREIAPELGKFLVPKLLDALGGADKLEAYGKAAIVGTSGEIEHASALIHTLFFGDELRKATSGSTYLSFTNKRAGPNCDIDVPLKHKTQNGARSHSLTVSFSIPDAPAHDELVIVLAGANGGRPHHRIGDRYEDMNEMREAGLEDVVVRS